MTPPRLPAQAASRTGWRNWGEYLALRAVAGFTGWFSVDQNLATARSFADLYARWNPKRMERARRSLAYSFPDWSREQIDDVAVRSMHHMFRLFLVDTLVMPRLITRSGWAEHMRFGPLGEIVDRLSRHEPTLMVMAHHGNWELLGYALAVMGFDINALARPLDNPLINRWLLGIREAQGLKIITKWGAADVLPNVIKAGGSIGFIADQNAGDNGVFVPFFGRLASTYKSISLLAMRHEIPVVTGYSRRIGEAFRYDVGCHDVIHPEDWVDQPDPLFYIAARVNRAMEQMITEAPEQYLWLHRRWKSRPRHEREGKPMPARLREKIEALPWMTPEELERIVTLSEDPRHREVGS